jgi:hypothetical protein
MAAKDLSPQLVEAGKRLLEVTDRLGMRAQGAAWIYDSALEEWRYYLVTSLIDTIGRRKVYELLLTAFEHVDLPEGLTMVDVYLGSPSDAFFRLVASAIDVQNSAARFKNCVFNGIAFDGVVYRMGRQPPKATLERIEKTFRKKVQDLAKAA